MTFDALLQFQLLNNPVSDWLVSLAILLVVNLLAILVRRVAASRLRPLAARTRSHFDDVLVGVWDRTHTGLVLLVSLYVASRYVDLPARLDTALRIVAIVAAFVQAGRWLGAVLRSTFEGYRERAALRDAGSATAIRAIGFATQILMWSLLFLLALDNLGVDVTAMVAGLGIGGFAVALAVQNILGDILARVSIIADRPLFVGGFVIVDECMGTWNTWA